MKKDYEKIHKRIKSKSSGKTKRKGKRTIKRYTIGGCNSKSCNEYRGGDLTTKKAGIGLGATLGASTTAGLGVGLASGVAAGATAAAATAGTAGAVGAVLGTGAAINQVRKNTYRGRRDEIQDFEFDGDENMSSSYSTDILSANKLRRFGTRRLGTTFGIIPFPREAFVQMIRNTKKFAANYGKTYNNF